MTYEHLEFVSSLHCPACGEDILDVPELYKRMEMQSLIQNEPQWENFVDIFRCGYVCEKCRSVVALLIKWTKIGSYVRAENMNPKDLKLNNGYLIKEAGE